DQAEHAERTAKQEHAPSGSGALRDRALNALAVLGRHAEELDELPDLHFGLRLERLALVERQHAGQLVAAALDHVGGAVQQLRALETGATSPGVERGVRCRDCATRILAATLRHRAERLTGCRTGGLGGGTARGVAPLAVDEHPCRHGVSLSARWCESTSESMEDIADFLRAHTPFDSFDEETLDEIAASAEIEFHAVRAAILDSPDAVLGHGYVVRRGSVELVIEG